MRALIHLPGSLPGLLIAVSASVDKIISHFGASRNLVQKVKVAEGRMLGMWRLILLWGHKKTAGVGDWFRIWTDSCCATFRPNWGIAD